MMSKRCMKVSFQGETKRLKQTTDYAALVNQTREAFGSGLPSVFKYFYLDDENEIISINSQDDFNEALSIEDFASLKLNVAANVAEARKQLEKNISDNISLAESINHSAFLAPLHSARAPPVPPLMVNMATTASDFERIEHSDFSRSGVRHEVGCGGDDALMTGMDKGTTVDQLTMKSDTACNTQKVTTSEKMIDTCVSTSHMGSQACKQVIDQGCDGLKVFTTNTAVQMELPEVSDMEVSCNLLMPEDLTGSDEEAIEQEHSCFKCEGTRVNKKGLPCRKCNGTGVLQSRELNAIAQIVREEVREVCTDSFLQMFKQHISKREQEQCEQVHNDFVCDGCNVAPIKGVRFMCSVCGNYDLCETCEAKGVHNQHPLLKIRKPNYAPAKIVCQFNSNPGVPQPEVVEQSVKAAQVPAKKPKAGKVRYSGRFVKESIGDKFQVGPGQVFTKSWVFRNDGETAWPMDVLFVQTSGDELQAAPQQLTNPVNPQQEHTWEVVCTAPAAPGRYTGYFRMTTDPNIRFGHKVWVDIQVVEPVQEIEMIQVVEPVVAIDPKLGMSQMEAFQEEFELMKLKEIPVKVVEEELIDELPVSAFEEPAPVEAVPEQPAAQLTISQLIKSPKQVYFDKAMEVESEYIRQGLINLYEFGYVDYHVNFTLLKKYEGQDINTVAAILSEGALTESCVNDIFMQEQ